MSEREPLAREAIIAGLLAALVQGAVLFGVPLTDDQAKWIQGFIGLAALAWTVYRVRPKVTPVASPMDSEGNALVPVQAE